LTTPATPAIAAQAILRFLRMSPQKVRLVIDLIRGRRAAEALQILRFTKKRAAHDIEKVLRSAIAMVGPCGFTPGESGSTLASCTCRLSKPWTRPRASCAWTSCRYGSAT